MKLVTLSLKEIKMCKRIVKEKEMMGKGVDVARSKE